MPIYDKIQIPKKNKYRRRPIPKFLVDAQVIYDWMDRNGVPTQAELASRVQISAGVLCRMLKGEYPASRKLLDRISRATGLGVGQLVVGEDAEAIKGAVSQQKLLHHDLDPLAGSWSREEASAFEKALAEQRGIDSDLWK